jgi:hypothetical protein
VGTSTPKLGDVIDQRIDAYFSRIAGPMPARVELAAANLQTVDVQPLVGIYIGEQLVDFPVLRGVPVAWPQTTLGSITLPIAIGDTVLIVPSGVALGDWHKLDPDTLAEPQSNRRFALGDCVAIVGITTALEPLPATAYAAGALVIAGADVRLGSSTASDFVALAGLVLAQLDRVQKAFDNHVHLETGGTTNTPTVDPVNGIPLTSMGSVACTTTKAL